MKHTKNPFGLHCLNKLNEVGLALTSLICFALICFFAPAASAQSNAVFKDNVVVLDRDESYVDLRGKVFVFEDKFRKYNLASAWKEINAAPEKLRIKHHSLTLDTPSSSYWMLLNVRNQSQSENWVLDFGDTFMGRTGFVSKIMVYDVTAKQVVLKIFGDTEGQITNPDNLIQRALSLDLPKDKVTQLMLYVEPAEKKPLAIAPRLVRKAAYFSDGFKSMDRYDLTIYVYLGLFFMMLTFTLMYRKPHQVFGVLFLMFGLIHYMVENTAFYIGTGIYEHALFFSYILTQISVFYFYYNYFYDKVLSTTFMRQVSMVIPALALVVTGFSVVAVPADYSYLVFLSAIAMMAIMHLFLMANNIKSKVPAKWLAIAAGTAYIVSYLVGSIFVEYALPQYAPYVTYIYVYGQLAMSSLLILSMPIRRLDVSKSTSPLSGLGKSALPASGSNFGDSKDMADRERLLRVLDRERELLEEARTREAQKTDEMRRAKEVADEANQAKSAFLAVISHEIRTPITGVLGMVKLLLGTQLTSTQKDYAQTIQDSGDAMLALLNDILDYEKIESGNLDLEMISFDVRRLMQGIERLMTGHAEAKKIGLALSIEPEVPEYIVGDPTRLRQVVLNLLSNAIKFTEYGEVSIIVKKIDVGTADSSNTMGLSGDQPMHSVYFGVQDSGIGLSAEAQKTLFTPFTQAKAETTRKYGGTGLGLSICQKLVNAMGGEISVSSKEHEGSTFFFTIDMQEGDAAEAQSEEAGGSDSERITDKVFNILAVDDNSINLKVLNGFIDKLGHKCTKVESGEEAIEHINAAKYDLVLMDVNMNGMSGLETSRHIRAMDHIEKSCVPIVALTGHTAQDAVHECYSAGMDDFLLKPVNPKNLNMIFGKLERNEFANELTTKKYNDIRQSLMNDASAADQITAIEEEQVEVDNTSAEMSLDGRAQAAGMELSLDANDLPPLPSQKENQEISLDDLPPLPSQLDANDVNEGIVEEQIQDEPPIASLDEGPQVAPLQQFVDAEEKQTAQDDDVDALVANVAPEVETEDPTYLADIEARGEIFESSLLEALKLSMSNDELMSLVDGFDEKGQEILSSIQEAYSSKDWVSLAARSHEMKGMSGNFGLRALSEIMKELEVIVKTKRLGEAEYFVVRAPMAYNLGIKRIRAWIQG